MLQPCKLYAMRVTNNLPSQLVAASIMYLFGGHRRTLPHVKPPRNNVRVNNAMLAKVDISGPNTSLKAKNAECNGQHVLECDNQHSIETHMFLVST